MNQRYISCGESSQSILVKRIPFVHISQLEPIFGILRQQLVMIELYQSCFLRYEQAFQIPRSGDSKKRKREETGVDANELFVELSCMLAPDCGWQIMVFEKVSRVDTPELTAAIPVLARTQQEATPREWKRCW